jgi:hypothetical protein
MREQLLVRVEGVERERGRSRAAAREEERLGRAIVREPVSA